MVDWRVSRLVRLILCRIILTASSPGRLLIYRSLVIHLLVLRTFAFRSSEVRRLLLDLDPYGGTDTLGMFPLFLNRTADAMAPRLSVVFRWLFVWVVSRLAGDRPISPQFRKVHRPLLLPITD